MKAGISVLALVVLSSLAVAISSAAGQDRETRSVADFEAIEVGGAIDLDLQQGQAFSVEVESSGGSGSDLVTEVRNGTLRLHHERSWFPDFAAWSPHRHTVHVTLPRLVALKVAGGSDVRGHGTITGDKLDIRASGGTDVRIDVDVAWLDVRSSGGADLWLTGKARAADMRSSGGSDLDASRLTTETARLSSSGGSDITIGPSGTLVASASGGSDIRYVGEPRSLTVNKSGGGDVSRRSGL